jgi:protease-4
MTTVSDSGIKTNGDPHWERKVLEKVALEAIAEQRRGRRWGIFFKLIGLAYLTLIVAMTLDLDRDEKFVDGQKFTALVNLTGVIQSKGDANAENIIAALQDAFEHKHTAGVILRINSPGGSPVQSGIINDEMVRLRKAHPEIPLHVVVEDVCASGGYYVAAAADKIYVDKASIVGSIGVLMDGFGFTGTMEKLGVERRLLTAGESKGFLDPFSPQNAAHKEHAQKMLGEIHAQFIEVVRKGRGKRLKETPDMFSGLMWTGAKSVELGLTDGLGTVDSVARDVFKAPEVRDFSVKQNFAEKFARQLGVDTADALVSQLLNLKLR